MPEPDRQITLNFSEANRSAIEEAFHPSSGGLKIFSCVHPVRSPQGVVLMTHGLGEHSGRYGHVIHCFQEKSLAVVRFDLRGHGRSEGKRGHARDYEPLLDDLSRMVRFTRERFPGVPLILFGHSLGGNILANWIIRRPDEASIAHGAVLSSPWFTLTKKPSAFKVAVIRSLSKIWPGLLIPAGFRPRKLTRNPTAIAAYEHDPLIHKHASVRLISDAYFAGLWALKHAAEFQLPVLALHGTADSVTGPDGTQLFCERAPHAELMLFDDLVHEPHNEPEWRVVVEAIRNWMVELLNRGSTVPPEELRVES
ncbi:lysophospholipase [Planctomicrobium sp. SH661]|uniref:alpha/beta hydrolase n=1 Tax=Planctomicrobium sp. SH661 TaxID=3448124 RepID=UPI003F5C9D0E